MPDSYRLVFVLTDDITLVELLSKAFTSHDQLVQLTNEAILHKTRQELPDLIIIDVHSTSIEESRLQQLLDQLIEDLHEQKIKCIPSIFVFNKSDMGQYIVSHFTVPEEAPHKPEYRYIGTGHRDIDDYIMQPIDIEELKLRVKNTLDHVQRRFEYMKKKTS